MNSVLTRKFRETVPPARFVSHSQAGRLCSLSFSCGVEPRPVGHVFLTRFASWKLAPLWCAAMAFAFPPSLPAADLVKFPEGPAAWTVEITPVADGMAPGEKGKAIPKEGETEPPKLAWLKQIEVEQDDRSRREVQTFTSGKKRETWSVAGLGQVLTEDSKGTVFFTSETVPFGRSAFGWITLKKLQADAPDVPWGKDCLFYKDERDVFENGSYVGTLYFRAWIHAETLRPVALIYGQDMGFYKFSPNPPAGPLMPEKKFRGPLETKLRIKALR